MTKQPKNKQLQSYQFESRAIHGGYQRSHEQEHSEAMFLTSSFVHDTAASAAAHFSGQVKGNIYSRFTNPTVRTFEQKLASLEGAERCVATASGMAAILATALAFLKQGDHVVCSRSVFGTTIVLFEKYLHKFGVSTSFVDLSNLQAWQQAILPGKTKLFFCESPSNPLAEVVDIAQLAVIAKSSGVLLAVDNCLCTPALQQPLALGADLVIHSATKYIDGQGRALGGAVVGSYALLEEVYGVVRTCGPSMSAFNAWVFIKGLETLSLRMKVHSQNALQLALWLQAQPTVKQVYYSGLPNHPSYAIAARQQSAFGGVLSFVVHGGRSSAWAVIDHVQLLSITANLGDAKSTITHPATTTHGRLSDEAKVACGIEEGLIRISVGLEDIEDIQADLAVAFSHI